MNSSSWVIVRIDTGTAVFETFSKAIAEKINAQRYKAIPILEYLYELNRNIKR